MRNALVRQMQSRLPALLLDESGCVLFSSCSTVKPGDLYVLGLNPGGPKSLGTIRQDLEQLPARPDGWNIYLDDPEHMCKKLADRMTWLLEVGLGSKPRNVCISNLIFRRTKNSSEVEYPDWADECWAVHELLLQIIQPKVILVYGTSKRSPYDYLKQKALENRSYDYVGDCEAGHGTWRCRAFRMELCGAVRAVVGIPHISWYKITGKTSVATWIKRFL